LAAQDIVLLGRLPHQGLLASAQAADAQAVEAAMQAAKCSHLRLRLFGQLSGGERQKVLLARALAVQAQALLMDEPLNHLDPPHQADWLLLAQGLAAHGHIVVAVLHDVNYALRADQLLIVADGQLVHQGSTQEASTHRAIETVFDQRLRIVRCEERWLALPQ
jgi:iron complex transport system ATP-binding protein